MKHFIKKNPLDDPEALRIEAQGLELLRENCGDLKISVPEVYSVDSYQLVMEQVQSVRASPTQMQCLGEELAKLHLKRFPQFGLNYDNYIGLSRQNNILTQQWGEFFCDYRLGFQIQKIRDSEVKKEFISLLEAKRESLAAFLSDSCEHPSLIHGDLWSGNFLASDDAVWLIDPAVYFGDREADLAMTEMFGGFSEAFYKGYNSVCNRSPNYPLKKSIFNLYHYLNHYNLFGDTYLPACRKLSIALGQV